MSVLARGNTKVVVGVIVLVAIAAGVYAFAIPHQKTYGSVAGHTIYQSEVDSLLRGAPPSVSRHDAVTALLDKYLYQKLAQENHVSISQSEISQGVTTMTGTNHANPYTTQLAANRAYQSKLEQAVRGVYKGQFIVAYFSVHIPYYIAGKVPPYLQSLPGLGDPGVIAADRKYASDFINRTYSGLAGGTLSFGQAAQQEGNDPRIGLATYPSLPHSGNFDTENATPRGQNDMITGKAQSIADTLRPGQYSKPFVVKTADSDQGNRTVDSYFMIVKADQVKRGQSMGYEDYVAQAKRRLGYRYA